MVRKTWIRSWFDPNHATQGQAIQLAKGRGATMSDIQTAFAIGAAVAIPVTIIGNWLAINVGIYMRNVKARRRY